MVISNKIQEIVLFDLGQIDYSRYKIREINVSEKNDEVAILLYDLEENVYVLIYDGKILDTEPFDDAWNLTFSPRGDLFLLISRMGEWSILKNGEEIGNYEYIWSLQFNEKDSYGAAIKKDSEYGMIVDGKEWERFYPDGFDFLLAKKSSTTLAVCRTVQVDEKDVIGFFSGSFSLVKNSKPISEPYASIKYATMDPHGENISAVARASNKKYLILINNTHWKNEFDLAWQPTFHPQDKMKLYAPVKIGGRWFIFLNGEKYFDIPFVQVLEIKFSDNGESMALICSKEFGKFTIFNNGSFWSNSFPLIEDVIISPDGSKILAIVKKKYPSLHVQEIIPKINKHLVLNDKEVLGYFDNIIYPKFSKTGEHYLACVKKGDFFYPLVDGNLIDYTFENILKTSFNKDNHAQFFGISNNKLIKILQKL